MSQTHGVGDQCVISRSGTPRVRTLFPISERSLFPENQRFIGNIGFYMVDHIKRGKSGLYPETDAFRGKSEIFRGKSQ